MLSKPRVKESIQEVWNSVNAVNGGLVSERIRACRKALSNWKNENNMNAQDKISQIQDALEREQSRRWPRTFQINILKRDLLLTYKEEEIYWQQKGRNRWLMLGDGNTNFFMGQLKVVELKIQ